MWIVLGALVVATLVEETRYYRHASSLVHPVRKLPTDAQRARAAAVAEDVTLTTSDGLTLRASWAAPKNGVAVVMGHGLFENRMQFLFEMEMLARHGYGALAFDWRAHGESD